jgi:hypothetical protein
MDTELWGFQGDPDPMSWGLMSFAPRKTRNMPHSLDFGPGFSADSKFSPHKKESDGTFAPPDGG